MGFLKMLVIGVFVVLLCMTSVLTSTVNETKVDSESNKPDKNITGISLQNNSQSVSTSIPAIQATTNKPVIDKNGANGLIITEGGRIPIRPTSKPDEGHNQIFSNAPNVLDHNQNNASFIDSSISNVDFHGVQDTFVEKNISSVVPKKNVQSKIVPRKGADQGDYIKEASLPLETTSGSSVAKPIVEPSSTTEIIINQHLNKDSLDMQPIVKQAAKPASNVTSNTQSIVALPQPHRPKPTATIGAGPDKPMPASPTKTPPLGMPRKIDYIVPVIITMIALPLLGVTAFFMYRRGRDCWDKRHYRRMDFLIDGMYND